MKKRRKAERGRAGKRKGAQPRSAATTSDDSALQESEAKFRSLVENTAAPIGITDLTRDITYVNKALADLVGYTVQELVGRPFMDFLHPEDREAVLSTFMKGMSTSEETPEIEFRVKRRDGQILTLTSKPTRFEIDGKTVGFQAIITDITERKKREEALRQSEERFRSLYSTMSEGVCLHEIVYDEHGAAIDYRIVDVNPAYESIIGLTRERAVGSLASEVYGTGQPPYLDIYAQVASTGKPTTFETYFPPMKKHFTISAFSPGKGKFATVFADITERKRAEEELRVSEEKHRTLFDSMAQGVVYQDADGRIFSANPAAERILGLTLDQMQGRTSIDPRWKAIHDDGSDFPGETHPSMVALKTGKEVRNVVMGVFNPKGEEYHWININAVPRFKPGETKPFQVYATFYDITERKRAEELLRENEKRFRHISSTISDVAYSCLRAPDGSYSIDWMIGAVEDIIGYSIEEIRAQGCWRFLVVDEDLALFEKNVTGLAPGAAGFCELRLRHKSGGTVWVDSSAECIIEPGNPELLHLYGGLVDITERKRMEEALRQGEQRYRMMFESMSSAAAVYEAVDDGKDFIFRGFNSAAERIEKIKRERLIGKSVLEIFPGLRDFGLLDVFQRVWRTGNPEHHPITLYKDARISGWRENYVYKLPSGEVVAIYDDVTESKRADEELRGLSQFRESIIDNANIWIDVLDEKVNIVVWNKAAELISGYSREEVVGHGKIWEWLYPDEEYRKELKDLVADVIQRGRVDEGFETRIRRKDGQIRIMSWNERNLMDENGKVIGSIAIGRDVTEHKRMEEELKRYSTGLERLVLERTKELAESEKRLRYAVALNPAVIYTGKPLPDYSDWVMTYVSERVVTMLGFDPSEFIGHPEFWRHHIHPDDSRFVLAEMPRLWKEGQLTVEYRFLHKDGAYRWIREETEVVREVNGKPVEVDGYWTDVTERKRMEARLAESQRLAGIGEAAAMVGHDLRNPLQGIVSTVYLAKRKLESPLESSGEVAVKPGLVDMLETIENEAEYMDKIVSDLQDYAAPLKAEPKPVEMQPLVKDTLSKIRIPQNVKVSLKVSEPLPTVMIDPAVMRRVFTNLIANAIQAMPDGGELTIDLSRTEKHLLVSFRDTGVGIPEEKVDKLFNPFFTTKAKGQGLGLAVCKKLVEAHDGRITVESKHGEGSTFTIKLPIIKP